ncbi:hypothetical protein PV05_03788 [Exophiala xenobiotica]|uniref:Fungal N-terminal domain-containing protein n=1 Tax=Exophiala xenobiotica TaxID=348802 RepID=A0A0D2FGR5_9EURO|nr:uncharacterized protein PV05_03788 [Exophiala xenobiotica]KIW59334.1 hypothetical protein PV05_03788 [Exophiala xenobiotica]
MAETVGLAAAGVGFASLAVQLVDCIHKLHDLHANIRDAPMEIRAILREVDPLGEVLTRYSSLSGAATETSLSHCSEVLNILRNIAHELETMMQTSRTRRWINWTKADAAFKRKRLANQQAALERAKSTLMLALMMDQYSQHFLTGNATILGELAVNVPLETVDAVNVTPEATVARPRAARSSFSITMYNLGIAMVMIKSKNVPQQYETDNNAHADAREVTISFASWLFNRAVALISHCNPNLTEMTLQIARLVRPDAEIFHLCAAGDALGVRKLIADGKASASDVTYEGMTPLMVSLCVHVITDSSALQSEGKRLKCLLVAFANTSVLQVAAHHLQAGVCRALLDAGADVTVTMPVKISEILTVKLYDIFLVPLDSADHPFRTALHMAVTRAVPNTIIAALKAHANPWDDYWVESQSESVSVGKPTITSMNTARVIVEHGGSSVDIGWSPLSGDNADCIDDLERLTPGHLSLCAPEDLLWLIAPERINLLGQELDLFYMSMLRTQCRLGSFVGFSAHRISALFQKVTDFSTLARIHDHIKTGILHHLLCRLPYIEVDPLRIILLLLDQLVQVGAIEFADSMGNGTPLMEAAWVSIDSYVYKYGLWRPEYASEILTSGLNLWLEMLGRAGVSIRQYFARQCELGATDRMACYVRPKYTEWFPGQFLDHRWYVEMTFWENPDATVANNPRDFSIGVKYYSVQCNYPVPGAWSDDSEQIEQSDRDDVQLRVDGLDIEDDDDDDDDDDEDGEGWNGDAEDENCDGVADPD